MKTYIRTRTSAQLLSIVGSLDWKMGEFCSKSVTVTFKMFEPHENFQLHP